MPPPLKPSSAAASPDAFAPPPTSTYRVSPGVTATSAARLRALPPGAATGAVPSATRGAYRHHKQAGHTRGDGDVCSAPVEWNVAVAARAQLGLSIDTQHASSAIANLAQMAQNIDSNHQDPLLAGLPRRGAG